MEEWEGEETMVRGGHGLQVREGARAERGTKRVNVVVPMMEIYPIHSGEYDMRPLQHGDWV